MLIGKGERVGTGEGVRRGERGEDESESYRRLLISLQPTVRKTLPVPWLPSALLRYSSPPHTTGVHPLSVPSPQTYSAATIIPSLSRSSTWPKASSTTRPSQPEKEVQCI